MTSRHHPTINPYVSEEMMQAFLRDLPPKETGRQVEPLRVAIYGPGIRSGKNLRMQMIKELLEANGCEVQILGPHCQRPELPSVIYEDELTPWDRMPGAYPGVMVRSFNEKFGCLFFDTPPSTNFTVEYPYQAPTKATADYKKTPLERLKNRKSAGGCHPLLRGLINRADR